MVILDSYVFLKEPLIGNNYYIIPEEYIIHNGSAARVDNDENLNSLGNSYSMKYFVADNFLNFRNNSEMKFIKYLLCAYVYTHYSSNI